MKIIEFDEIQNNIHFWLYFLSVTFPLAVNPQNDTDLSDFISENYDCNSASEWVNSFLFPDENPYDDNDGYSDNPVTVAVKADNQEYTVQFHQGDTLFLLNEKLIASTGSHYDIHKISFQNFIHLTEKIQNPKKSLLILPIAYINECDVKSAEKFVSGLISELNINLPHINIISEMIIEGLKTQK